MCNAVVFTHEYVNLFLLPLSHSTDIADVTFILSIKRFGIAQGAVTMCLKLISSNLSRTARARHLARNIVQYNIPCDGQKRCKTSCPNRYAK